MSEILTIARWSRKRLLRGKLVWIAALLILMPATLALLATLGGGEEIKDHRLEIWQVVAELALRFVAELGPALLLANALGEELELRTYTYLWSRPMRREALLFGKLVGALPILVGSTVLALALAYPIAVGPQTSEHMSAFLQALAAGVATTLAASCFAIGVGALVPKHPFVLALGVLAAGQVLSIVPNVARLSVAFHARALAGQPPINGEIESAAGGATGLVVLAAIWLGLAVWRARRAELAAIDV